MYVCYTFVVVPVNSVENRIMCMHEYYTVVLVPDDPNVETYRMCVCVGRGGCLCVYCTFVLVPAVSVETRIMYVRVYACMYVCLFLCAYVLLYCSVSARQSFT